MNRDPQVWARLGQAFAAARKTQGLTQEELADQAGVSLGSVQRAEAGSVPKSRIPITLHPIAKALGWPDSAVDDVLEGRDAPDGWRDVSVQHHVSAERLEEIVSGAMLRTMDSATAAEIKAATAAALDAFRREGII